MARKNPKEYSSIGISKKTKKEFKKLKEYPRETDEETLIKIIEKELKGDKQQC
jgi:hypothetical protein